MSWMDDGRPARSICKLTSYYGGFKVEVTWIHVIFEHIGYTLDNSGSQLQDSLKIQSELAPC